MTESQTQRIPTVSPETASAFQREQLDSIHNGHLKIFRTLINHPGLFRHWLPFGAKLMYGGKLEPRVREFVILRVAWLCKAAYEWGEHVPLARQAGLENAEIEAIPLGADYVGWTMADRTLLAAVDELVIDHCISDEVWGHLAKRFSDPELIELALLAGHYALIAAALNSFGVQAENGTVGLGRSG